MKKIIFLLLVIFSSVLFGQYKLGKEQMQLNAGIGFSSWGLPIYGGLDYGIHKDVSIGGEVSFRSYSEGWSGNDYSHTIIGISANANYHFTHLLKIPREWDVYAGLNLGFYSWSSPSGYGGSGSSGVGLGAQVGARYYFNNNWGINLEFGGGNSFSGGKIGITYILD